MALAVGVCVAFVEGLSVEKIATVGDSVVTGPLDGIRVG